MFWLKFLFIFSFSILCFGGVSASPENDFLDDISVSEIASPSVSESKVIVAIVDDGIRASHEELRNFVINNEGEIDGNGVDDDGNGFVDDISGWDVSDQDNKPYPPADRLSDYAHGTHLAGIITKIARATYGKDAHKHIKIMPVKVLSDNASKGYLLDGYHGVEYAINAGADIILTAWGQAHITPKERDLLREARKKGVLVIASAGNFADGNKQYPAANEGVLAVASLKQNKEKSERSNFGSFIDISAPGERIISTSVLGDTEHEEKSGSSQAAAMVAAAGAIMRLQYPSYSVEQIVACLKHTADEMVNVSPRFFAGLGAGSLNIKAALTCDLFSDEPLAEQQRTKPHGVLYFNKHGEFNWDIKLEENLKGLRFFVREKKGNVGASTIRFYTQGTAGDELLRSFALAEIPESVYVPGNAARVEVSLEEGEERIEWMLEYRGEPIDYSRLYCEGTQYLNAEGSFEDGSGSEDYAFNSSCKWLITAPKGKVVRIVFDEFDTEGKNDLIYFFHGSKTNGPVMAVFSGPDMPPELVTWGNQVLVWFVTNGDVQRKGWKADYSFEDREPYTGLQASKADGRAPP